MTLLRPIPLTGRFEHFQRPRGAELAQLLLELIRFQSEATSAIVDLKPTIRETVIFGEIDLLELADDLDTFFDTAEARPGRTTAGLTLIDA